MAELAECRRRVSRPVRRPSARAGRTERHWASRSRSPCPRRDCRLPRAGTVPGPCGTTRVIIRRGGRISTWLLGWRLALPDVDFRNLRRRRPRGPRRAARRCRLARSGRRHRGHAAVGRAHRGLECRGASVACSHTGRLGQPARAARDDTVSPPAAFPGEEAILPQRPGLEAELSRRPCSFTGSSRRCGI